MHPPFLKIRSHELGKTGLAIESVFEFPQDIEWAYEKGALFILQSRSIRTLKGYGVEQLKS